MKQNLPSKAKTFSSQLLKGFSQIMLQEHVLTGSLFLIGIFVTAPLAGIAALVAGITGTLSARILNYDQEALNRGIYGFSATLSGVACLVFFKPVLLTWIILVVSAIASTMLQHFFYKKSIPVFTFPFVLVTWTILFYSRFFSPEMIGSVEQSSAPVLNDFTVSVIKSFGQIIFQNSVLSGSLFLAGVFISSTKSALFGLVGAICATSIAFLLHLPTDTISDGLYGFNAVLCAITFAGKEKNDFIFALSAVLLSLGLSIVMLHYNFTQLTFPFVVVSALLQLIKTRTDRQ